MTPAQQSALEACAGRPLVQADIDILAPLLGPDSRSDVAIAAHLSIGRKRLADSMPIGVGTILGTMAPDGGSFLNIIEALGATDANCKWTLHLIMRGAFDIALPITRVQLGFFAVAHPELAGSLNALLAVAERDDPIHYNDVSDALNIAEGRLTLEGFKNGQ